MAGAQGAATYFGGDPATAVGEFAECVALLGRAPGNNWERSTSRLFQLFSLRFVGDFVELRARYEDTSTTRGARRCLSRVDDAARVRVAVPRREQRRRTK